MKKTMFMMAVSLGISLVSFAAHADIGKQPQPKTPVDLQCDWINHGEYPAEIFKQFSLRLSGKKFEVTDARFLNGKRQELSRQSQNDREPVTSKWAEKIKKVLQAERDQELNWGGDAVPYTSPNRHPNSSRYIYARTQDSALQDAFNSVIVDLELYLIIDNGLITGDAERGTVQLMYRNDQGPSSDYYSCVVR